MLNSRPIYIQLFTQLPFACVPDILKLTCTTEELLTFTQPVPSTVFFPTIDSNSFLVAQAKSLSLCLFSPQIQTHSNSEFWCLCLQIYPELNCFQQLHCYNLHQAEASLRNHPTGTSVPLSLVVFEELVLRRRVYTHDVEKLRFSREHCCIWQDHKRGWSQVQ